METFLCQECLDENNKSLLTKGYGKGYIPNKNKCLIHKLKPETETNKNESNVSSIDLFNLSFCCDCIMKCVT